MSAPYGLISDLHCHAWSAFSSVDSKGRNTRLMEILNELSRCCAATLDQGGDTVVIAGDLFHVRGSVEPEVFNPVKDCITHWYNEGIQFLAIAGNHDLTSEDSQELGSAVAMLDGNGFLTYHTPGFGVSNLVLFPWVKGTAQLKAALENFIDTRGGAFGDDHDLILHAGIDGVLPGMPDHGLTPAYLAGLGFKRVFSGHYHNAKQFESGKVVSIGAPTHQTWSDLGSRAGWWIVHPTTQQFYASHAPSFIDLDGTEDPDDIPLIVDGHYVRARIGSATNEEVASWRELLTKAGARGVSIQSIPATAESKREGVTVKSLSSLSDSVLAYCTEKKHAAEVAKLCQEIMQECAA
ncbi:MAG: metallophosphoesterase [Janthinobacterium lividum]